MQVVPVFEKQVNKRTIFSLVILLLSAPAFAHTINYGMEAAPGHQAFQFYLRLGFQHIIPLGFDHLLFVVGLCLASTGLKSLLLQATAFTVAHSVTLALSIQKVISLPADIVEPIISLSILFIAVENLVLQGALRFRMAVVFLFGLIHGMGFAAALNEIGLPRNKFLLSILSFNVGVEIAQVVVILLMFFLLVKPFGQKPWYRNWVLIPFSLLIALAALYWTTERLL